MEVYDGISESKKLDDLSAHIWAAAQVFPYEGITDSIERIKSILIEEGVE